MSSLPFPKPQLTDGVVAWRPWRDEDAPAKTGWGRDRVIVRWTGVPENYTEEAARARAVTTEDATDPALGEVGYLVAAHARGRGVATRAVGLLVDWSFRELEMERVQALVHPDNSRSAGVLEHLGFKREGLLRRCRPGAGGREDRLLFAVLPEELVLPSRRTIG